MCYLTGWKSDANSVSLGGNQGVGMTVFPIPKLQGKIGSLAFFSFQGHPHFLPHAPESLQPLLLSLYFLLSDTALIPLL